MLSLLTALALVAAVEPKVCAEGPLLATAPKEGDETAKALAESYVKYEYRIAMRDGVKLYTVAFVPRARSHRWPILLLRTPYGVSYGVDNAPVVTTKREVGRVVPGPGFIRDGFIFVQQDVRGRMMSEGTFVDVRPRAPKGGVDEATDAYDTIDFLVKNVPANNGKVGVWGISYPGFYAAQAGIDAHPALKAISPQAPVTDWFIGDDFHHNGALFLQDSFSFMQSFGRPRPEPVKKTSWAFEYNAGDGYEFYLGLGPVANVEKRYFKGAIEFWSQMMAHPNNDAFWQARNPLPNYRAVKPAVLTVGGLFDAEDVWGSLATYHAYDAQSPGADVRLVLGPWRHGGWVRTDGDRLGDVSFGFASAPYFQEHFELPFFQKYLKGCAEPEPAEAWVFETGTNLFQKYDLWPPKVSATPVYFAADGALATTAPSGGFDEWVSDPKKPVPHSPKISLENNAEYMVEDQRFAARRPDVIVHQTAPLETEVALAGPVEVSLEVSTTGTDADFIVKLIDVSPADRDDPVPNPTQVHLAGFQQLVRGEVFRGRFRKSFSAPEAFVPNQPTSVHFTLPDVSHAFRPGHRLMIQVQSTWFPLVDRNPQRFVDINTAEAGDFQSATHRLYWAHSTLTLPVLRGALPAPGASKPSP